LNVSFTTSENDGLSSLIDDINNLEIRKDPLKALKFARESSKLIAVKVKSKVKPLLNMRNKNNNQPPFLLKKDTFKKSFSEIVDQKRKAISLNQSI
jgi:hypothetical protein